MEITFIQMSSFQKHARPFKITITVADGTLESINVHIDEKLHRLDTLIAQLCEYIVKYSQLSHASEDTLSNEGIVSAWHSAGIVLVATAAEVFPTFTTSVKTFFLDAIAISRSKKRDT